MTTPNKSLRRELMQNDEIKLACCELLTLTSGRTHTLLT